VLVEVGLRESNRVIAICIIDNSRLFIKSTTTTKLLSF
jgi:hypothetical protein